MTSEQAKALTKTQIDVLRLIAAREVGDGVCLRYVWKFQAGSRDVTRHIHALEERSLVQITYYRNSAAVNLTDIGRNFLARHDKVAA